jgi:LCP family protein required for cell wall assembly
MIGKLMKSKLIGKKFLSGIIIAEILIGSWALVFIGWALWNKPLGPSMQLPQQGPETAFNSPGSSAVDIQGAGQSLEVTPTPSSLLNKIASLINPPASTKKGLCGAPAVMTLLVIGTDQRDPTYIYGLADSIRLVRIDFSEPNVMVLDIPRDLWVEIPGIADHGVTHGKINQAYFFGNPGMGFYDGPGEGPGLLARTLDINYGFKDIDHYLAMNMQTFKNIIDSVGGVDIYLNSRIDLNQGQDGANPDYVYEPGYYHLDGERALMFARDRNPTIFQRARYQDIILRALQEKILTPGMIPELPGLISQFSDAVQTDLSPNQVKQLLCISEKLNGDNTRIVAFPDDMFSSDSTYDPYRQVNTYTLAVDNALLRSYFSAFMNGTWPEN